MNGLQRHLYQIWWFRLSGSLLVFITTSVLFDGLSSFDSWQLCRAVRISVSPSCTVLLSRQKRGYSVVKPANCMIESPGSLPLLWSLGYKKPLDVMTLNELTWISGIGRTFGTRILMNRNVDSWRELGARAKLSERQLERLRQYVRL